MTDDMTRAETPLPTCTTTKHDLHSSTRGQEQQA